MWEECRKGNGVLTDGVHGERDKTGDAAASWLAAGEQTRHEAGDSTDRQTISFIEISIEAGKLLGGKHKARFVLGVAGIEPMSS